MQQAKPSFLEYFEQKEKESNKNSDNDNRKLPAEADMEVVSVVCWELLTKAVSLFIIH